MILEYLHIQLPEIYDTNIIKLIIDYPFTDNNIWTGFLKCCLKFVEILSKKTSFYKLGNHKRFFNVLLLQLEQ